MKKILITENNIDFSYVLKWHFEQKGFSVFTATTGDEAISLYEENQPDIILLDINIDGEMDGKDVARAIRSNDKTTPIIFMSGESNTPKDVVEGFDIGCNFFLKKPVSIDEIEVHILALTQNNITNNQITIQDSIQFKHCYFNPNNREITIEKQKITLSEKETAVLHYLASNLSECVNLYDILEEVWDDSFMEESLRNVISTLRKKIINTGLQITTIKNKGYLLEDNGIS